MFFVLFFVVDFFNKVSKVEFSLLNINHANIFQQELEKANKSRQYIKFTLTNAEIWEKNEFRRFCFLSHLWLWKKVMVIQTDIKSFFVQNHLSLGSLRWILIRCNNKRTSSLVQQI